MWPSLLETADLVSFTEETFNEKLHFFTVSVLWILGSIEIAKAESYTVQKMKFSIKDFLRISCGFGHIYWRNP